MAPSGSFGMLREVARGKSFVRHLANASVRGVALTGRTLEIGTHAGGTRPSHWRFLDGAGVSEYLTVDIDPAHEPTVVADVCERIPFPDASFDTLLCFNLLEHLEAPEKALVEMRRVLKAGGLLVGAVPFLFNVHGDPHDWRRYTATALAKLFAGAGFDARRLAPVGGPFAAAYGQVEALFPVPLRLLAASAALLADRVVGLRVKDAAARWPVYYVFECR